MKRSLLGELKRRNVLRAGAVYLAAAWLLMQIVTQLFPVFDVPAWAMRWIIVALILGFPFWIVFAWLYEVTPEGLKLESEVDPVQSIAHLTGKKLDQWIFAFMGLAIVLLLTNTFVWHEGSGLNAATAILRSPPNSVAVLPFSNLSADKNQEYFSDGISEDVLNLLTKVSQLQVTARTSSFSFRGEHLSIPQIARRLHVAHILEGSVQKVNDQVRITVQLVDAATDTQRWSQTYDRKVGDVFKIQDEIAGKVVKALRVKLLGGAPRARSTDPRAYALYLQARELGRRRTVSAFEKSDALYQQALAIDPTYAPGWEGLAQNYVYGSTFGAVPIQEGLARARQAAEKALVIDPDNAAAHAWLGRISMNVTNNLDVAAKQYERALTLNPGNLDVLRSAAYFLQNLGRLNEALRLDDLIVRRDPVNVNTLFNLGITQGQAGRSDAAIRSFRTLLNLSPNWGSGHFILGVTLLLKGDANAALTEMNREKITPWHLLGLAIVDHSLGHDADSDAALAELISKYQKDYSFNIAYVYAFRGEADKAFEWLEKAVQNHDPGLSEIVPNRLLRKIHSDPRWLPFLRQIGYAPEQLAKIKFKVSLPKAWQTQGVAKATTTSGETTN